MLNLKYQSGFGNEFATEAIEGALPLDQNSPQRVAFGLYAEQFSGTPFTAPRASNHKTWTYRIRPSVCHKPFKQISNGMIETAPKNNVPATPNQLRWDPLALPTEPTDFIDSMITMAVNGNAHTGVGMGVHIYAANASMTDRYFYSADGELLIVPQLGELRIHTELGILDVAPCEICVLPRGLKFRVELLSHEARGYVCENYGAIFKLPELGVIGANALANPRHFLTPVAAYEDREEQLTLIAKFHGNLWEAEIDHSPLDVVAWHGNYVPYKYDLRKFNTINTVTFDHPDPSIFTVLTSLSDTPGTANVDFAIFPPRWVVAEHTFRPPYFHRNLMSEFMGLIKGQYDAKPEGFIPGGSSLHNCMSAHGPDNEAFEAALDAELKPIKYEDTLAFMFESRYVIRPTQFAMETPALQKNYYKCWSDLKRTFGIKN